MLVLSTRFAADEKLNKTPEVDFTKKLTTKINRKYTDLFKTLKDQS